MTVLIQAAGQVNNCMAWSAAHLKSTGVVLQALAGCHRLMNAAVGGAAVLSVLLSVASPAQADPEQ